MPAAVVIAAIQAAFVALMRLTMFKAMAALSLIAGALVAQTALLSMLSGSGITFNPFEMGAVLEALMVDLASWSPWVGWAFYAAALDVFGVASLNGFLAHFILKFVLADRIAG